MPILGLDLGSKSIKAIELDNVKGGVVLKKFGYLETPREPFDSNKPEELQKYSDILKEFILENDFGASDTVVSLPESDVFTRVIKVPQMNDKDLKSSIVFEAEQYIPLPLKDVTYDFQVIGNDPNDKSKMEVLLVAAKKDTLSKYVSILKSAKLKPHGLEPETISLGRAVGDSADRPSANIIVNIGSLTTQVVIVYKGFVRFTRSISIGGDALTRAVSQKLSFDYKQAEEYKKTYGLDKGQVDGKVHDVIKPVFDNIVKEIKRSKIFYTTHNPNVIINRVILSGGTALMPGLLFYMASNVDLEVELANPWRQIKMAEKLQGNREELMDMGPRYVSAVGLALKGLDN